jgi:hypothetical protein
MNIKRFAGTMLLLILALASPALAGTRCLTYEEQSLGRLQTLCDDGARATSTWNRTLERWETTLTPPPGQTYTAPQSTSPHSLSPCALKPTVLRPQVYDTWCDD